jgi:hypothetical protein
MAASAKSDPRGKKPAPGNCGTLGGPDCACRAAVTRAFAGMMQSGAPYDSALSVARRVFHHHHPELDIGVRELIERWVSPESLH